MKYLHGCNYPWSTDGTTIFYGLDFGASVWRPHLGVSTRRAAVARDFADMAALGFTSVRWFVFCDGRAGIVYDDRGLPAGPDAHLFADLDAALEVARDADIRVDFVLLDHRWMFSGLAETLADPVTGLTYEAELPEGRARVLLSTAGRDALLERVMAPVVRRYGPSGARADLGSAVLAYELMNEPDFVVEEWEQDLSSRVARPLRFDQLAELVSRLSHLVHAAHPAALTTLGCARAYNLWAWDDEALGLDMLQVHSYPDARHPERDPGLLGTPAAALGVRRPVILGEFPGGVDEYLEFALSAGYAGAWPWSFSGTDRYGRLPREPLRRFAARHPELVNPRARL
ncbi:MAG: hypothetical protein HYY76_12425 [Acidobacteria bacterium]|nr:hypothetical protein [Acidobacteriota bacterium]